MKESLLWDLMLWASMLSQQPMPESLPDIQYVSADYISKQFCKSSDCQIDAMYVPESRGLLEAETVYIKEDYKNVNTVYALSIIVHEFVHYLQDQEGSLSPGMTCKAWLSNERQAYRAQALFLKKHRSLVFMNRQYLNQRCTADG